MPNRIIFTFNMLTPSQSTYLVNMLAGSNVHNSDITHKQSQKHSH